MSAYITDPRTIDYLVAYAQRHANRVSAVAITAKQREAIPVGLRLNAAPVVMFEDQPVTHYRWPLDDAQATGMLLLAENIRSVRYRYPNDQPDQLPGPVPTPTVEGYRYNTWGLPAELRPEWVIRAADCLEYQSCETPDWKDTAAFRVLEAIREHAISALVARAGASDVWEITDGTLEAVATEQKARRAAIWAEVHGN